jgi:ATP-dependent protease ClpP protease subunit
MQNKAIPLAMILVSCIICYGATQLGVQLNVHHNVNIPKLTPATNIVCSSTLNSRTCIVRLSTTIEGPEQYNDLLELLDSATEKDTIELVLVGNGGRMATAQEIVYAMQHSRANVITKVVGDVYSAHAYIAIFGKTIIINPYVTFLFHMPSLGGKAYADLSPDEKKFIDGTDNAFLNMVTPMLQIILSPLQYAAFLNHQDVYVTGQEVIDRLTGKGK